MPMVNGMFSNRYQEQEDYEFLCGAEAFPYVILRETDEPEPTAEVEESVKLLQEVSFFKRLLSKIKFQYFKLKEQRKNK